MLSRAVVGLVALPGLAFSQSTLIGSVTTDSAGRHPLIGAEVSIPAANKRARTDSTGTFRIDGLKLGHFTVLVRSVGYQPSVDTVAIDSPDGTLYSVVLAALVQPLDTVRTKNQKTDYISPALRGFEERRRAGFGYFIGEEILRQFEHQSLVQLTRRLPGTTLTRDRNETYLASSRKSAFTADGSAKASEQGTSRCFATVYFNGVLVYDQKTALPGQKPPNLDDYLVTELAGIEYYGGEAAAPKQFKHSGCGILLLWTRER